MSHPLVQNLDQATKKNFKKSENNACHLIKVPVGWYRKVRKETYIIN
jgi:hypothetical protein